MPTARLLTIKRIHKLILQNKLKWIKRPKGLTIEQIRQLYTEQLKNGISIFSEEDLERTLKEDEPVLGGHL